MTAQPAKVEPAPSLSATLAALDLLRIESSAAVLHVRLNRPAKRNAVSDALIAQLHTCFINLPEATRDEIRETAKSIYVALGCEGLARVDMFLQDDGRVVLNEVNTLPGFTAYSRYPRMMAAAGRGLSEVIDRCISLSIAR